MIPLIVCSYDLRMFERPLIPVSGQNFDNLGNCMWCIIITMTTVGYGDYYPISNLGRFIGILACLWGVFIVSIFVVTLTNLLEFTKQEQRSYEILQKLSFKDELRLRAVNVIISAQKQKKERQKDDLEINSLAVAFRDFKKNVFDLKQTSKRIRAMYEDYNDVELITKDVEDINQEIELLLNEQAGLLNDFKNLKKKFVGEDSNKEETTDEDGISNSLSEIEKQLLYVPDPPKINVESDEGENWNEVNA